MVTSDSAEERDSALQGLFGNICHQGTVYEATIYAVPFLIELLPELADVKTRSSVACLLAVIINGKGFFEVHGQIETFKADWQEMLSEQGTTLDAEVEREKMITGRIRELSKTSLPLLAPFLYDWSSAVRWTVAEAIACFPEFADEYLPLLTRAMEAEQEPWVKEIMQEAIDRLSGASSRESDENPTGFES
ncbi:MAG: hypothetical protein AAF685_00875 [Cyanobacteria bacterium P01_C01_bin.89]